MKLKIFIGLVLVVFFVLGCERMPEEKVTMVNLDSCQTDNDCTYYYNYNCIYPINKDHPNAQANLEQGPPMKTANCFEAEAFDYVCASGKCEKEVKCDLICDQSKYGESALKIVLQDDCPATSQMCNLYKECGC